MSDQPVTESKKFNSGDRLVHPRGATAKILALAPHRRDKNRLHGYLCVITQADGAVQQATLALSSIGDGGWRKATDAEAADLSKAELAKFDEAKDNNLHSQMTNSDIERLTTQVTNLQNALEFNHKEYEAVLGEKLQLEEQLRVANAANTLAIETAAKNQIGAQELIASLEVGLGNRDVIITELRVQIERLEDERDDAREERNSAIDQLDEANKLIENRNERVSAAIASADLTTAPSKEFAILTKVLTGDLARMDKEGWNVEYMQFSEASDLRAVYSRYCHQPAPQPERAAAKTFVPDAILETQATPSPADVALDKADLIAVRAEAAQNESPLPRFNAQAFLETALNDAVQASQEAYETIISPIRPLRPELAASTPIRG